MNPPLDPVTFWIEQPPGTLVKHWTLAQAAAQPFLDGLAEAVEEAYQTGGRAEPVIVVGIDPVAYAENVIPRGLVQPTELGQRFLSARLASLHLGYPVRNEVAQRLGDARRKEYAELVKEVGPERAANYRLRPKAALRGVTFQYEKDVPE